MKEQIIIYEVRNGAFLPKKMFRLQEQLDKSTHKEKVLLEKLFHLKQKKKDLAFRLHQVKYHQPVL